MKVIPYSCVIQLDNQEIRQAEADGGARVKFCHYTSLDTLKIIIRDKTIKLNRIDLVNDLTEKIILVDLKHTVVFL